MLHGISQRISFISNKRKEEDHKAQENIVIRTLSFRMDVLHMIAVLVA